VKTGYVIYLKFLNSSFSKVAKFAANYTAKIQFYVQDTQLRRA